MENQIIKKILEVDNDFNEAIFKSYVDNIFVKLYTAIMLDELKTVRHFLNEDTYQKFNHQIEELNKTNKRQMYDELNVKSTSIIDFQITEENFIIKVELISRYMDYYLEKDTGNFISGNNKSRIEKKNILTLTKKRDSLTQKIVRKCPGCGASISVNTNGICEYCGTTYNQEDYNYILTNITTE